MNDECGTTSVSFRIRHPSFRIYLSCLLFLGVFISWTSYAADSLTATARREFDQGKYQAAAALLESGLAQSPREGTWAFWLARCYMELGNLDRALDYAQWAVASDPNNSEYHHWLGKAHGLKADKVRSLASARKCREEFETAVRLSGTNLPARRDLLEFYLEAPWFLGGGNDKAWQQALAISELDPIEGFLARGFYWETLKDPRRAEAEYTHVMELRPASIKCYFEVAEFYQQQENATRLQAVLEDAARLEPQDARWPYYRGVVGVLARTRLQEAEQELGMYLASPPRLDFPSHASAREWLGRLYEESDRPQLALKEYRAALQLDPGRKASVEALKRLEKAK
jgi:tetratricopeptide (TPR) repeat protein